VKLLLLGAITINVVASLYLLLIAPILVYGWNNTAFNAGWAFAVAALLLSGIGGSIAGFLWRNTRPSAALLITAIPAVLVIAGFLFATVD
jgi:hypothetical protein